MADKNEKKELKEGFTTGTASAAAVKGALYLLLGEKKGRVTISFLSEGSVVIPLKSCFHEKNKAVCTVIKDAGDDPDITHNQEFGAKVAVFEMDGLKDHEIVITGGKGVGTVTKPGLEVPPGNPAINPGPVKMIRNSVYDVLSDNFKRVEIEIFVPKGEELAEKTLNKRLGIIGGISILGTTGIVKPMSHDAYIATIKSSIDVASANNVSELVFTTGRRSERFSQKYLSNFKDEAFVQIGDFFQKSLELSSKSNAKRVILSVFFGKAVKMALGFPHTHAGNSELTMDRLSDWTFDLTGREDLKEKVLHSNTAREAFFHLYPDNMEVINFVGNKIVESAKKFAKKDIKIDSMIFDFEGEIVFKTF